MPAAYSLVRTSAQAGFALRPPVPVAGVLFHHWSRPARLHLPVWRPAPLARASDAVQYSSTRRLTLLLVQPFALTKQLLWLLLTSRSALPRRPFRHEARSPRVRTHSFTAQPPDIHHLTLATRASRLLARSPCSAVPRIRFLFIGSRFTLHASSPRSVTLPQLRFTSFAVASSREDLHLQECARAGRTKKTPHGGVYQLRGAYIRLYVPSLMLSYRLAAVCISPSYSTSSFPLNSTFWPLSRVNT